MPNCARSRGANRGEVQRGRRNAWGVIRNGKQANWLASACWEHWRKMESFRGRYTNKVDAKGRVSVPAKFRAVTAAQGLNGIICFPSIQSPCVEGGGPKLSAVIDEMLDRLDPFSPERDVLAAVLVGDSYELTFDSDGRVVLPEELREHSGISNQVTFVGLGAKFQIWEPAAYETFRAEALSHARSHSDLLKSPFAGGGKGAA